MREGNRVGGQYVVTHAVLHSEDAPTRFGYITSKKIGNAVTRNLVNRRLKGVSDEILRETPAGADIVFRALPKSAGASYAQLRSEIHRQLARLCQRTR